MDLKTLLDNLHEEVSCSVCMTTFTEPKQLPCLHSFCLHCLEGILRTSGRQDIIACPKCRREIRLPASGNLNDLPTNFRINSLLDVLAIKECNTTGVKCGNCDKKSAQSLYCFQCSSFWCDFCITGHNIIRTNAGHRVLALKDFEDQDIEDVLKRPAFCQQKHHENEELKFFCKDCEVAICHSCVATIHEGHAKILLEEAASERKLHVQIFIESLKQIAEEKLEKIGKLDGLITKVEENVGNVKREVEIYAARMVAVIEAKKAEIFYELDFKADESIEHLAQNRTETGDQVDMVYTEIEKSESFLKRSTSAEIVQFDGLLDTIRFQEDPVPPRIPCFRFVGCENNFWNLKTNGIGSVKVTIPGGCNLYVKNLDNAIDDARLREEFSAYGTVISAKVMMDDKNNSRGFGFVAFSSEEEATKAINEMNGRIVVSKPLYVALDRRPPTRSSP